LPVISDPELHRVAVLSFSAPVKMNAGG